MNGRYTEIRKYQLGGWWGNDLVVHPSEKYVHNQQDPPMYSLELAVFAPAAVEITDR